MTAPSELSALFSAKCCGSLGLCAALELCSCNVYLAGYSVMDRSVKYYLPDEVCVMISAHLHAHTVYRSAQQHCGL